MNNWIKISDYAKQHNITTVAVYRKIKRGTILSKKIRNLTYVQDLAPIDPNTTQTAEEKALAKSLQTKQNLDNELKQEKLKNLRQDTLLKKQKNALTKQLYRQQYAEGVFQCFSESFGNVKKLLIDLKLTAEQNKAFQTAFAKALKAFENKLSAYLQQKDKEQEKQITDEETKEN